MVVIAKQLNSVTSFDTSDFSENINNSFDILKSIILFSILIL